MIGRFCRAFYRDEASEERTTVLLSSGRSGSTWLGNALHAIPDTRLIFEPFHPRNGVSALAAMRYRFIDADRDDPDMVQALTALMTGETRSDWCDQFNPLFRFRYDRRLLKEVRINLLMPWLTRRFPNFRYVLLLRHPAAVVQSQLRGGWNLSSRRLRAELSDEDPVVLNRLNKFNWPDQGFESNLIFWALENRIALRAASQSGSIVVFYENLCLDPGASLAAVERHLDVKIPATAIAALDRPSWSSSSAVAKMSIEEKVAGWQKNISGQQKAAMLEILEACELTELYGFEPLPSVMLRSPGEAVAGDQTAIGVGE